MDSLTGLTTTRRFPWPRAAAVLLLLMAGACDDRSGPPPVTAPPPLPKDINLKPTTQELTTGPRTKLDLNPYIPAVMDVPAGWSTKNFSGGEVTILHGATPGDFVEIQLSRRAAMSGEQVSFLIDGAKREMADAPDRVKRVDVRPLPAVGEAAPTGPLATMPTRGMARVFERQAVGRTTIPAAIDDAGKPATRPAVTYQWKITFLIPQPGQADSYGVYEMNFIGMTDVQYAADEAFLRPILDSLRYSPAAK